jgi:hypothetical protein
LEENGFVGIKRTQDFKIQEDKKNTGFRSQDPGFSEGKRDFDQKIDFSEQTK